MPSSNPDLDRLWSVYSRAADLEGEERAAWVKEACGGDDRLRDEVEEMLAGLGGTDAGPEPLGPLLLAGPTLTPGTRVDRYTVIEHVASGGMAEVYAAHEEAPPPARSRSSCSRRAATRPGWSPASSAR